MSLNADRLVYLIATQRSGTHLFNSILNTSGVCKGVGEVFHAGEQRTFSFFQFHHQWMMEHPDDVKPTSTVMEKLFDDYHSYILDRVKADRVIVDAKYNSLHHFNHIWQDVLKPPHLFDILAERGIRIIHLIRQDILDTLVSSRLAKQDHVHVVRSDRTAEEQKMPEPIKLTLDVNQTAAELRRRVREINTVRRYCARPSNTIEIYYEQLAAFANGEETLADLQTFLGIEKPFDPAKINVQKVRPSSKADKIKNWEVVRQELEAAGAPIYLS